ncbi:molybdopterin synthase catalytic subunit MoaE [Martelella alba]|uniref:Molybdopterin synthase catalytic subunit n=1 Tax=Martelella alba TaxID=2590451 RepID=A0ABY2SN93_9HYPH|nr:molybdopterin synthase catalytic subunit MoaE [Martelella alba]TKI07413.1 molybdopterin synthase catalytic subunit MoaE [Martelella alba]
MAETRIRVDTASFDMTAEYAWLSAGDADGAVVTFTGKVRNHNQGEHVAALTLEHYPGMTERALADIAAAARRRWALGRVTIIHRVGELRTGESIVLVGVSGAHREAAFQAAEFIMDYLKTRAPFWKRETIDGGSRWVDSRASDHLAAERWRKDKDGGEDAH